MASEESPNPLQPACESDEPLEPKVSFLYFHFYL